MDAMVTTLKPQDCGLLLQNAFEFELKNYTCLLFQTHSECLLNLLVNVSSSLTGHTFSVKMAKKFLMVIHVHVE